MPKRMYPTDYFGEQIEQPKKLETETSVIPNWVPILIGISLVAMALVALYAISKINVREYHVEKRQHPLE